MNMHQRKFIFLFLIALGVSCYAQAGDSIVKKGSDYLLQFSTDMTSGSVLPASGAGITVRVIEVGPFPWVKVNLICVENGATKLALNEPCWLNLNCVVALREFHTAQK
jgi:hypothetical protein